MTQTVELFNTVIAIGGIVLALVILGVFLDLLWGRRLETLMERWGMLAAFVVASGGTVMTLIYSEVFGFVPCGLCWLQRIFLYPLVILTGMALYSKDTIAARYGLALALPGLVVALYQHYLQIGGSAFVACPQSGADCTKRYMFEFGFMTFPLLSAILFAVLIILLWYVLRSEQAEN